MQSDIHLRVRAGKKPKSRTNVATSCSFLMFCALDDDTNDSLHAAGDIELSILEGSNNVW